MPQTPVCGTTVLNQTFWNKQAFQIEMHLNLQHCRNLLAQLTDDDVEKSKTSCQLDP